MNSLLKAQRRKGKPNTRPAFSIWTPSDGTSLLSIIGISTSSLGCLQRWVLKGGTVQIEDILSPSEPEKHPEDTSGGLYPRGSILDNVGACSDLFIVFVFVFLSCGLNPRPPCMLSKASATEFSCRGGLGIDTDFTRLVTTNSNPGSRQDLPF